MVPNLKSRHKPIRVYFGCIVTTARLYLDNDGVPLSVTRKMK